MDCSAPPLHHVPCTYDFELRLAQIGIPQDTCNIWTVTTFSNSNSKYGLDLNQGEQGNFQIPTEESNIRRVLKTSHCPQRLMELDLYWCLSRDCTKMMLYFGLQSNHQGQTFTSLMRSTVLVVFVVRLFDKTLLSPLCFNFLGVLDCNSLNSNHTTFSFIVHNRGEGK
jgi:hypothetical protein